MKPTSYDNPQLPDTVIGLLICFIAMCIGIVVGFLGRIIYY